MSKTFKEIFQQEKQISAELAKHWGYNIKNIVPESQLKKDNAGKMPKVANINTLRTTKEILKTQKIVQIQEQLRAIQNGRLLDKFTQQASKRQSLKQRVEEQKSTEKVKQYNYIINHKHLNKNFHEQTRKILKIDKNQTQRLLEKVQVQKGKLKNVNLSTQIQVNKELAKLYKSYRRKVDRSISNNPNNFSKTKTTISSPPKSDRQIGRHEQIGKYQQMRLNDNNRNKNPNSRSDRALLMKVEDIENNVNYTQIPVNSHLYNTIYPSLYRKTGGCGNVTDRTSNRRPNSNLSGQGIQKSLNAPFVESQKLDKYRLIEKINKSNHNTLGLFKDKIKQFKTNITTLSKQRNIKQTKTHQSSLQNNIFIKQETDPSVNMNKQQQIFYNSILSQNKLKYEQQKNMFAELLKKRHQKFNRVGFSKVLMVYDQKREAKQLLRGDKLDKNTVNTSIKGNIQLAGSTKLSKCSKQQMVDIFDEKNEDQHYQRMCKNQKINLMLKHK